MKARGKGTEPIKRETGLAKETVRRFHHMRSVDELLAKVKDGRPSILDEHKPYLHQRWSEGCANVIQLHTELKERGYKGSHGTIRDHVLPLREAGAEVPRPTQSPRSVCRSTRSAPTARHVQLAEWPHLTALRVGYNPSWLRLVRTSAGCQRRRCGGVWMSK